MRRGLNISPRFGGNHQLLGQILLRRGQPAAALKEMEAERSESRDSGLALLYHALGRGADSAAALARMEQEHPLEFTNIAIAHASGVSGIRHSSR
jgi:hypothetical protein